MPVCKGTEGDRGTRSLKGRHDMLLSRLLFCCSVVVYEDEVDGRKDEEEEQATSRGNQAVFKCLFALCGL